jgi:hypothetical protein
MYACMALSSSCFVMILPSKMATAQTIMRKHPIHTRAISQAMRSKQNMLSSVEQTVVWKVALQYQRAGEVHRLKLKSRAFLQVAYRYITVLRPTWDCN